MALTKEVSNDEISVDKDGTMGVLEVTRILEDGVEIFKSSRRRTIYPGDDLTCEEKAVCDIGTVVHTKEVKDAYLAKKGL